jgi:hypothetical protein
MPPSNKWSPLPSTSPVAEPAANAALYIAPGQDAPAPARAPKPATDATLRPLVSARPATEGVEPAALAGRRRWFFFLIWPQIQTIWVNLFEFNYLIWM